MVSLEVNTVIADRYQLIEELGRGGMGVVYRVIDLKLNRHCAIKFLRQTVTSEHSIQRFKAEGGITARLSSPYIVQVIDEGRFKDYLYIVMELIHGAPLNSILKRENRLTLGRALLISKHILSGLAEAHANDIVHRDLKPANILIVTTHGGDEIPKILDFGIAKELHTETENPMTKTNMVLGTPKYMSPEQFSRVQVDPRADFYTLGLILYQMISGRFPFELSDYEFPESITHMPDEFKLGWLHINTPVEPLDLPSPLNALLESLLAKRPDDRPQDALTAIQIVQQLEGSLGPELLSRRYQGERYQGERYQGERYQEKRDSNQTLDKRASSDGETSIDPGAQPTRTSSVSERQRLESSPRLAMTSKRRTISITLSVALGVIAFGALYMNLSPDDVNVAQDSSAGSKKVSIQSLDQTKSPGRPHSIEVRLTPNHISYKLDTPVQVSAQVYDRARRVLSEAEVKFTTDPAHFIKVNEFNDLEFRRAGRALLKACVKDTQICDQVPVMVITNETP